MAKINKIGIIGGCGHVGLTLGIALAQNSKNRVILLDINKERIELVNSGKMPFLEKDGEKHLKKALKNGLYATNNKEKIKHCELKIFTTGTPIDERLSPKVSDIFETLESYKDVVKKKNLVVMRSTIYPTTSEKIRKFLPKSVYYAFCPERTAENIAIEEIAELPQIISAFDKKSEKIATELFQTLGVDIIYLTPLEAELLKLMVNAWRYLEFAIPNQMYMIAESNELNFYRIFEAIRYNYPRANSFKGAGLTAGPCLFKDTMQLAAFYQNKFFLGHSAMLINEGLANFIVEKAKKILGSLYNKNIAILGMTFKANSDDLRDSLSIKIENLLIVERANVLTHDSYVGSEKSAEEVITKSDLVIIGVLHDEYKKLKIKKPLIDIWGYFDKPKLEILKVKK